MPKISIIIPVHNVRAYIRESLDSVVGQSLHDIEIVCVDDHSDDGSAAILGEYAARDSRVRVITFPENLSASQARKDGVLAATGEYLMFLDADDSLAPDACERLYEEMRRDPVDILHFGAEISADKSLPDRRVEWMRRFVEPHAGRLTGDAIVEGAFLPERVYNFSLWDKLYSAEVCRRAFSRVRDGSFPKGQDKYAYFLLSYFAGTYRGVPGRAYYRYNFGRGVTGHNLLTFPQFERYCSMGRVADAIRDFLAEEGALDRFAAVYENVRRGLLNDCVANWSEHLDTRDRGPGFDLMLAYWEAPEVIARIANLHWNEAGRVARFLANSRTLARPDRQVRVVGTYYHRMANGGAQRVMALLIKLWIDLGYSVVLFTDEPPTANDYNLPDGVEWVVLPSCFEVDANSYGERARFLRRALEDHAVDVMVYHAWVSKMLFWDLLVCKTAGTGFVAHCHNVFSQPTRATRPYFADMPPIYHLCDTVIALSEVDRAYWSEFNDNVIAVVNPLTFHPSEVTVAPLEDKTVLWLGRIATEKRPLDALRVFAKVLAMEPDARLLFVGGTDDREAMDEIDALVGELGIGHAVEMCGFQRNVLPYYERSSVFLMTSEFEGAPLVLAESQAVGLPCVMYELPYLSLTRSGRGHVAVEMGDVNAAADAVAGLLSDRDRRAALGREARANIEAVARFDFAGVWRRVFAEPAGMASQAASTDAGTVDIMWQTLLDHYRFGAVRREKELRVLRKKLAAARKRGHKAQQSLERIRGSFPYRVWRAITFVPRRVRARMKMLQ